MGSPGRFHAVLTLTTALVLCPYVATAQGQDGGPATPPPPAETPPTEAAPTSPTTLPPPLPPPVEPEAQAQLHASGRLAALLCQGQPLRAQRCRYGQASGLVTTYFASGSVSEVLQFREGLLDGLIEVYDPSGHLIERTLYRAGLPQPMPSGPTSVQVPGEPSLPLPPSIDTGAPTNAEPGSAASPVPMVVAAPPPPTPASPAPTPSIGLGVRGLVGMLSSDLGGSAYTGLQLVMARYHQGMQPELSVGVATLIDTSGLQRRLDVPMSFGYLWNLSRASAPLYLAATFDVVYARRDVIGSVPGPSVEEAWMMGGSGGIGINIPVSRGPRSAVRLLLDMRVGGTGRVDGNPPLRVPREAAEPAVAMGSQFRLLFTMTTLLSLGG